MSTPVAARPKHLNSLNPVGRFLKLNTQELEIRIDAASKAVAAKKKELSALKANAIAAKFAALSLGTKSLEQELVAVVNKKAIAAKKKELAILEYELDGVNDSVNSISLGLVATISAPPDGRLFIEDPDEPDYPMPTTVTHAIDDDDDASRFPFPFPENPWDRYDNDDGVVYR